MTRLIFLTLVVLTGAFRIAQQYEPVDTCEQANAIIGGEEVPWIGYPLGWRLPSDLKAKAIQHFTSDGGVWRFHSDSENMDYVVWFLDYQENADANGDHYGGHHFCGVWKVGPS